MVLNRLFALVLSNVVLSFSFGVAYEEKYFRCGCVVCTADLGKREDSKQETCHTSIHHILQDGSKSEREACIQVVQNRPEDCGGCNPHTCFGPDHPIFQSSNRQKIEESRNLRNTDNIRRPQRHLAPSRTLDALQFGRISGPNTANGMHNPESDGDPDFMTEWVNIITGDDPGLYSADFLYTQIEVANRRSMIDEVINQWEKGSIVNLMWHACPPHHPAACWWDEHSVLRTLEDWEWNSMFSKDSWLNRNLNLMLDDISLHLIHLKDAGVELMFRPFHEMNQPAFWWGGRPDELDEYGNITFNGSNSLFRYIHDYYNDMGLDNLIWVWDMQDFSTLQTDLPLYDPGTTYWSVLALDFYEFNPYGLTTNKYDIMRQYAGSSKLIGIGEIQTLPTVAELNAQPEWSFFMIWPEKTISHMNQAHSAEDVTLAFGYTRSQSDLHSGTTATESSRCGCHQSCDDNIWNRDANGHTCGDRIVWLQSIDGGLYRETDACFKVSAEYPDICGECNPEQCGGASVFTTPDPTPNPTRRPSPGPTPGPTPKPTLPPTAGPTSGPTQGPTPGPTPDPSPAPTPGPTEGPTPSNTREPLPESTQPAPRCGCTLSCTDEVWNQVANGHTCGSRIKWLQSLDGGLFTEDQACYKVSVEEFPLMCGGCNPQKCAGADPTSNTNARCECHSCSDEVWNQDANGYTCGARIEWLLSPDGGLSSRAEACFKVSVEEYPEICGECNPEKCIKNGRY